MRRAAILVLLVACRGFIDDQAAQTTLRILEKTQIAAQRQTDVELARAAIPGGLLQLEAFALAYPDHRGFRDLHADALCGYVAAFVFDDWEDAQLAERPEAAALAARVTQLAQQCIAESLARLPAAWRTATGDAWLALVARAGRAEVAPLRWIATSEAILLALEPLRGLTRLPAITAALARCIAVEPGDGDAALLLGSLEAGKSRFLGGPDGSARFAAARRPGALMVDVTYARAVLVARKDRVQLEATLRAVLATDVARWPERRLANELAKKKAARYLAHLDRL